MKKNCSAALLTATLALVFQAEATTLAWYRFEDAPPGTLTTSASVIGNSVGSDVLPGHPYVRTQRNWSGTAQSGFGYSPANLMPQYVQGPNEAFRVFDPVTGKAYDDAGSLLLTCADTTLYYGTDGVLRVVDDEMHPFLRDVFTIEFFVKFPVLSYGSTAPRRLLSVSSGQDPLFFITLVSNSYLQFNFYEYVTNPSTGEQERESISGDRSLVNVKDGKWHHVAFVVTEGYVRLYVDYSDAGKGAAAHRGQLLYGDNVSLTFGGDELTYLSGAERYIDEVRISDIALSPSQFLTLRPAWNGGSPLVSDDTLLLLDFEGGTAPVSYTEDFPTTYTVVPAFQNKARPSDLTWASVEAEVHTLSQRTDGTEVTNAAPVRFLSEVSSATERAGLANTNFAANTTSCSSVTNSPENDYVSSIVLPAAITPDKLFEDSVTIEVSFRLPGFPNYSTGQIGWGTGSSPIRYFGQTGNGFGVFSGGEGSWDRGYLQCSIGGRSLTGSWAGHEALVPKNSADGKWHHIAIVYDRDAAHADFYLDGVLRLSGDDIQIGHASYPYYCNRVMLGGNFFGDYNGACCADIAYDDLRITRGVLKPYQFLTSRAAADGSLARADYDSGFALGPYADFFPAAVLSAFVEGSAVPATTSEAPARKIFDGMGGAQIRPRDEGAASFAGGMITYPSSDMVCDQADVTVEFFLKSAAASAGAGILRLNRASSSETSAVSWALSFADVQGGLSVAVDTDSQVGAVHTFGGAFADGMWHHVAVTFAEQGGDTLVTAYKDWEPIGTHVYSGRMMSRFPSSNLMLGAGTAGVAFNGCIDELRITPGVLSPESFLWFERRGLLIEVH